MNIAKIWTILNGPQKRKMFFLLILMLVGVALETAGIGMMVPVMSTLVQQDSAFTSQLVETFELNEEFLSQKIILLYLVSLMFGLFLAKNLFLCWLTFLQSAFGADIRKDLSSKLFVSLIKQPYVDHTTRNTSQFIQIIQDETMQLITNVVNPIMLLLTEILVLVCIIVFVLSTVSLVNIFALSIPVFGVVAAYMLLRKKILVWGEKRNFHETMRIKNLQQGFGGIRDIKVMHTEQEFFDQFNYHNDRSAVLLRNNQVVNQTPRLLFEVLGVLGLLLMVYFNHLLEVRMDELIVALGLFGAALLRLAPSASRILSALQRLRFSKITLDLIHKEMSQLSANDDNTDANQINPVAINLNTKIELDRLSYRYPGSTQNILTNVSLTIKCGQKIGIVGPSGSGKSTLINIMLGLLNPKTGTIFSDGIDVQVNLAGWQKKIGYVPQQIYLSDDTLRRNIAFGVKDSCIDEALLKRAVGLANLGELVSSLEFGLDNMVGERGVRLSGGQQQRIGLARALYHRPSVLILDEATSALDKTSEKEILRVINSLQENVTIIMVAHQMSTLAACDIIYEINQSGIKTVTH